MAMCAFNSSSSSRGERTLEVKPSPQSVFPVSQRTIDPMEQRLPQSNVEEDPEDRLKVPLALAEEVLVEPQSTQEIKTHE